MEETAALAVVGSIVWAFRRLKKLKSREMSARGYALYSIYLLSFFSRWATCSKMAVSELTGKLSVKTDVSLVQVPSIGYNLQVISKQHSLAARSCGAVSFIQVGASQVVHVSTRRAPTISTRISIKHG